MRPIDRLPAARIVAERLDVPLDQVLARPASHFEERVRLRLALDEAIAAVRASRVFAGVHRVLGWLEARL